MDDMDNDSSLDEDMLLEDDLPLEDDISGDDAASGDDDGEPESIPAQTDAPDVPGGTEPVTLDHAWDRNATEVLAIKGKHPAYELSDDSKYPSTDVVHVAAICPQENMHSPNELFGFSTSKTETTELVFRVEMSSLLAGDLTEELAKQQAVQLLLGLVSRQAAVQQNQRRAIIFVAYDLGSLVLKLALILAARSPELYPGIATSTSRIIFSGCPQRALGRQVMETKLFQFLQDKKNEEWSPLLTLAAIHHLADAVLLATRKLIESKMTLRSRIVSLHGDGKSSGKLHMVWDYFTATLGVPSEKTVQEQIEGDTRFPLLPDHVAYDADNLLLPSEWHAVESALLPLAAPHCPSQLDPSRALSPEPVLNSAAYTTWIKPTELRPLYVYGSSHRPIHDISDQISLAWQKRLADKSWNESGSAARVFTFDSADPLRDSISDMLASLVLEATCVEGRDSHKILRDWYLSRAGWSEESCVTVLEALRAVCFKRTTLFVLHDLEQCSRDSRTKFLDYIERLSSQSERAFKVMITSRNPQALHGEIRGALTLDIDGLVSATHDDGQLGATSQSLTRLCPSSTHKTRLEELLAKFTPMDEWTATKLRFAQHHTEWPVNPSLESVDQFTRCVESISPAEAPETQLDKMLRATSGYEDFRWILGWVICGYRPLNLDELCDLLRCHRRETDWPASTSSKRSLMAGYRQQLKVWLRVLAEFENDKVTLRREIRNILDREGETESFIWTEARATAHRTVVDFCLAYLASAKAQSSLEFLFSQLLARVEQQPRDQKPGAQRLTGSIIPDGERILFYLVQALPYHLSRCSPADRARALERLVAGPADNPYTPWAKVYWAMSNPFSRTPEPPGHPLPTLVGLDMVPYENLKKAGRLVRQQCILAAAGSRSNATFVAEYLREAPEPTTTPFLLDVLFAAIRAHNEQLAVDVVLGIASLSERKNMAIKWPESVIWAAAWLDMDQLATTILSRGASPDPQDGHTTMFPCPLYLASCLGHESIVEVLADHGAKLDRLRDGVFGSLQAAASRGHAGVLKQLVAKDRSLLESRQPYSGLYYAASYGHWKAAETLLELGADPEPAQGAGGRDVRQFFWNPLAIACRWSYPRVTETLLSKGADPNSLGPRGVDTPLWFAAVHEPSVDCVETLLQHGADPNHARLSPPLLLELAGSPADEDAIVAVCNALLAGDQPVNIQATGPGRITALMMAASRGRLTLVRWLLNNGANFNALDDQKESALHYAVSGEKIEVVKELLERKARINTVGGPPVLHKALDQPAIVKLLLDAGANPEVEDDSGHTLINRAVVARREDVIEMLIAKKANLDHPDSAGWPPVFDAAIYVKSASITRLLVDNGADLTKAIDRGIRGGTLLHYAVLGPLEIMKIFLEFTKYLKLDRPDARGQTALLFGSGYKWATFDCLKLLVLAGADVNAKNEFGERPLHNTIMSDQTSLLSLLLDQPEIEVNCAADWYTPLQLACRRRNMQAVYALLDHGARVNQVVPRCLNSTALVAALRPMDARRDQDSENIDRLVRELVSRGADVKQAVKGNVVYTALSAACLGAGTGTINFLLDEGASADLADPVSGRLPLHFAAMNGIENFRAILLAYRGDIMRPDSSGKTCLHWAAQFGNAETVSFILSKAGDDAMRKQYVSAPDEHQWTPLCWAVRGLKLSWAEGMVSETPDHAAVVRTLLENGADPLIGCPLGNGDTTESVTLLELARRSGASDELISRFSMLAKQLEEIRPDGANRSARANGALVRRYTAADGSCDVCLSNILGYSYKCTSCPDYEVCTTCLPTIAKYHNPETWDDNLPHTFERKPGAEYQDLPAKQDGTGYGDAMPRTASPEGSEQSDPWNKTDDEDFVLNDLEADLALEDDEELED